MPYFYPPPQPVQASPHVPIGNQGDSPPRRTNHGLYVVRGTWSEPSWPAQYGPRIAPLTLTYGDQPPSRTLHSLYQVRGTWPEPAWPAQSEPPNASWNVIALIVSQPPTGLAGQINQVRALWPEANWPAQYGARITPLTLVYGDQPPRFNQSQPVWPQPTWNAQCAAPNASWNVPALIVPRVPPQPVQWQVWRSWLSPPQPLQRAVARVQPSTGDQPRPRSIYLQMAIRNQWPEFNWPPQSAPPNAGWNFPFIPPIPPPSPASVTVRAFALGYFDIYRNIGDTFVITTPYQYSPYWMTFVDTPPADWTPYLSIFSDFLDREMLEFGRPQ